MITILLEKIKALLSELKDNIEQFGGANYSNNEISIGKWIDGRTIYRKVFNVDEDITLNTTFKAIPGIEVDNIDMIIQTSAVRMPTKGSYFIASQVNDGNITFITYFINGVTFYTNTKIIIDYVKTENEED